ncbi:hypothetical protein FRC01_003875 [Tulasnella sp. 417]|nr:hypothetical protein FRC01_003875 [Tulasnella sp. 417]
MDQGTRSGFQWGGGRGGREQGPDGWNVAGPSPVRAPAKAGDLSNFGKFTTSPGPLKTMGPSSVFKRSPGARNNSLSPTGSLFNGTAGGDTSSGASSADAVDTMPKETRSEGGTTPKPGVEAPLRKKLQLLPRTISLTAANEDNTSNEAAPESDEDQTPTKSYTDEEAKAKVDEDVKEFFNIRDVTEGEKSFIELPKEHKSKLVDKLASKALDMKEDDVELVAQVFEKAAGKACPPSAFEEGLTGIMEFLEDTATDVPQVYNFMAKMLRGSKLPQETIESLADKIRVDGDPEVKPKDKLLKAYAALD